MNVTEEAEKILKGLSASELKAIISDCEGRHDDGNELQEALTREVYQLAKEKIKFMGERS